MNRGGFTAVELVVVVIVLAILLGIFLTILRKYGLEQAKPKAGSFVWECLIRERPEQVNGFSGYYTGTVEDGAGVALIGGNDAAFWVKDGTVYTVNEAARMYLPQHPQAPPAITAEAIRHMDR